MITMKTIKSIAVLLLFMSFSCDVVEDKVCDVAIDQLEDEYKEWILEIENDTTLSDEEKEDRINELNNEKNLEIKELRDNCDFI